MLNVVVARNSIGVSVGQLVERLTFLIESGKLKESDKIVFLKGDDIFIPTSIVMPQVKIPHYKEFEKGTIGFSDVQGDFNEIWGNLETNS